MVEEKKDIAVKNESASPATIIQLAIEKGNVDLDKLERVMVLQERFEANQAKKAYNAEMVEVQNKIPLIAKSLNNPQTHSKYASLDSIIVEAKKIYTAKGFSICFHEGETNKNDHARIWADVVHELGHKETYYYDVPLDGKGIKGNPNMTGIHGKASSVSYARRYLMCLIFNIPTGDESDGNVGNIELISNAEKEYIDSLVNRTKTDMVKFLVYLGIEKLELLPKKDYAKATTALKSKLTKGTK